MKVANNTPRETALFPRGKMMTCHHNRMHPVTSSQCAPVGCCVRTSDADPAKCAGYPSKVRRNDVLTPCGAQVGREVIPLRYASGTISRAVSWHLVQ
jgi:hypothetical protein